MKNILLFAAITGLIAFTACDNDRNNDQHQNKKHMEEHRVQSERIDELETKLSATEAQLMNVKVELAKNEDSSSVATTEEKMKK